MTHYMEEKSAPQRKGWCDSCDFIILPYSPPDQVFNQEDPPEGHYEIMIMGGGVAPLTRHVETG